MKLLSLFAFFVGAGVVSFYTPVVDRNKDIQLAQAIINPFFFEEGGSTFDAPFEDWDFRRKITIDNTKIASTLTDFPVYINLADFSSDFFSKLNSNGTDIRFAASDGTTQLPRENVFTDTGAETGEIYVKVASISSSVDTDIYIYYGNSGASEPAIDSTYGAENAWDTNYKGVYHLHEDPSGGAPQILDSTSNDNDGTSEGTMTTFDSTPGKFGNGLDFEGTDDAIDLGATVGNSGTSDFTWEAWIEHDLTNNGHPILATQENAAGSFHGANLILQSQDLQIVARAVDSDTNLLNEVTSAATTTSAGVYGSVIWTKAGSAFANQKLYWNGVAQTMTNTTDTLTSADFDSAYNMHIAAREAPDFFDGEMDEVRVSWSVRAAAWITSQHNNQSAPATFTSIAAEETP